MMKNLLFVLLAISAFAKEPKRALMIIDVQNDFVEGGSMGGEADGKLLVDKINKIREIAGPFFSQTIVSQDWHPADHCSFASTYNKNHPEETKKRPNQDQVKMKIGDKTITQTLWEDHCVQGTPGAEFVPGLNVEDALIFQKGADVNVDSYSAFRDNSKKETGLHEMDEMKDIDEIYIVGIAYDFCVGYSALDAKELEFKKVVVVKDACPGIDIPIETKKGKSTTMKEMTKVFRRKGIELMTIEELLETAKSGAPSKGSLVTAIGMVVVAISALML